MKRLIQNNFLYYFKNKTKLFISLAFIASFIMMLFVYDNFELNQITKNADMYRMQSYSYQDVWSNYVKEVFPKEEEMIFWNEVEAIIDEDGFSGNFLGYSYDGDNQKIQEQVVIVNRLIEITNELGSTVNGFASLHAGGRMNVELTPYRHEINKRVLEIYDLVGEETANKILSFREPETHHYVAKEQERLDALLESATPDDFNEYTVTIANYPSKALEGYTLFVIFVFVLMLFYDLFSKDFDFQTYRTIYTEPYPRKTVIKSKIYFAILYTLLLIVIGMLSVVIYLLFTRRMGYNVLSTRFGYMLHPVLINVNILSIFNASPTYIILPMIVKNLLAIIIASGLITVWLLLVLTMSFKTKSSPTTLTISVFILLALFFINLTPLKDIFILIFPLFGFNFERIFNGNSPVNIYYIILSVIVYRGIISYILNKSLNDGDLLGGDNHD